MRYILIVIYLYMDNLFEIDCICVCVCVYIYTQSHLGLISAVLMLELREGYIAASEKPIYIEGGLEC